MASWMENRDGGTYNYIISRQGASANLRLNVHFNEEHDVEGLDLYAGIGCGKNFYDFNDHTDNPFDQRFNTTTNTNFVSMEATVGARYYVINNFGFFLEAGYAKSIVQAGIILKYNKRD